MISENEVATIAFWGAIGVSLLLSIAALSAALILPKRPSLEAKGLPVHPGTIPTAEWNGQAAEDALIQWSPDMLRHILEKELPDEEVIVVSNREPYVHERVDGRVDLHVPASGLVSALEPITRTCAGTWIAHGSGTADRDVVDRNSRIAVPPDDPAYTLRRVWLSDEEYKGYYSGFANEALWPLCHIAFTRPIFRAADWECYQAVNRKFAEVVAQEARSKRP